MNEVSCRAVEFVRTATAKKGMSREELLAGTGLTPDVIADFDRRISWDEFAIVMDNASRVCSEDDFVAIGHSFFGSPLIKRFFAAGRLLFTARDFYFAIGKLGAAGNQLFSCVEPSVSELEPGRIALDVRLPEGFAQPHSFFLITRGAYEHLPVLMGLQAAQVVMKPIPRGTRYEIGVPEGHGVLYKVQQILTWPFRVKGVAEALEETNKDLIAQNIALEEARQHLERRVVERTAELETANDQLGVANADLKEAQTARDRFFANISHEVRSPLTLVRLAASQLEKAPNMPVSAGKALGSIEANVSRLLHLVDGLLLLAAGQEGKLKLKRTVTDIARTVEEMVSAWQPACDERGITLHYEGPTALQGSVDRAALERMVSNFISNATKFTPKDGRIDVRLSVTDGPGGTSTVRVDVQDSGIGIPPEAMGRLFGRFEQGPAPVRAGERGSGIGLSIVKELAEAHGGKAFASSEVGKGTCMSITFPLSLEGTVPQVEERLDRSFMAKQPTADEPAPVPEPDHTGGATIVLAEDDPGLREAIAGLLSVRYRVIATPDGKQALAATKVHHPDLLVTDLEMPEMNGLELSREFRKLPGNALVPVLMVTAHHRLEERLEGFDAGAVDYVTKPFLPEELLARVGALLALRRKAIDFHTQEKLLSLGVLSASLAHEIRNPVNGMVNALEPLRAVLGPDALKPGTAAGELFSVLEESAVQVATLSKQLLGFADKAPLAMRDSDVGEVVNRAITILGEKIRKVTIEKDYRHTGTVPCSPPFLCQVFVNLLDNGAHAAGPGGRIRISTETTATELVILVADSGPGIDESIRARLFEPFVSTKKQAHGTGLGLFTSRQVMDRHGGTIAYQAPASFRVTLPLKQVAPAPTGPGGPRGQGDTAILPGNAMKRAEIEILYVDDERANRVVFEHTVNATFRVKTAETPSQALDLLDQHLCAVIVTDQRMPEMAGNELLAIVRERHPSVVRVVVTAYSDLDPILAAVNQGLVARYVVKPWERQQLLDVLRWAVDAWDVGLESASLQMRLLANERLAAIGALTSAVFHDMRQPLAMASTNAQRLVQLKSSLKALGVYLEKHPDEQLGAQIKELVEDLPPAVDDILLGCEFVGSLADSVRSLLAGSSRVVEPDTAPRETISRAMSLCRDVVVMGAGAQLAYVGPAQIPAVVIQSTDLLQVFVNLLLNAANSFEGVARLQRRVEVDARIDSKEVVFTVVDNGVGMAEAVLKRVGTPFFTTRSSGTGLGTSQCLRLAKKAGGDVRFQSEVGVGTTVSVAVPVAASVA